LKLAETTSKPFFQQISERLLLCRREHPLGSKASSNVVQWNFVICNVVSFLAGSDSDYMTGQPPLIDGGLVYR